MQCTLNGIVEHDVLFGQFQQHGVIKELVDGDVLTQALQGEWEGPPSDWEHGGTCFLSIYGGLAARRQASTRWVDDSQANCVAAECCYCSTVLRCMIRTSL